MGALAIAVAPFIASAQKTARVGLLRFGDQATAKSWLAALAQGLQDLGYFEGRNFTLEARFAEGKVDRLPAFANELVGLKVDLIVSTDTPSTQAAQNATSAIPIVFTSETSAITIGAPPPMSIR